MHKIQSALKGIDNISEWSGRLIAYFVVGMMLVILIEVVARYVFQSPTRWAHETAQMLTGSYGIMAGAIALLYGTHVKMDLFYTRWSERTRAIVDSATALLVLTFLALFLWQAAAGSWHSVVIREHSASAWGPPTWPYYLTYPLGVLLISVQALAQFIRNVVFAITGKEITK